MQVLAQSPQLQQNLLHLLSFKNFPNGCEMHVLALNVGDDKNRQRLRAARFPLGL